MIKSPLFVKNKLAVGVASAMLVLSSQQVSAASFEVAGFDVNFDSTFSFGVSQRIEERDFENQIGKSNRIYPGLNNHLNWNGYNAVTNPIYSQPDVWAVPGTYSTNGDAGNLNFEKGDVFSQLFKGTHELSIAKDNFGLFTRFMYFYDSALMDGDFAYSNPLSGKQVDPCEDDDAKEQVCADFRLLDAFIYADFDLNDGMNPLSIRLGQQVVNWGESALISHGINVNPVDIDRLKAPGADLKEAFIPVGMLWASLGITDYTTLEMFYQYDWQKTRLPVAGSYFSTNDFAAENGYLQNIQFGFGSRPEQDMEYLLASLNGLYAQFGQVAAAKGINPQSAEGQALLAEMYLASPTSVALRLNGDEGSVEPDDGGQYGIKLGTFLPELNDTEVAAYFINYHSRRPVISGIASNFTGAALQQDLGYIAQNTITADNVANLQAFTKARLEYVEDIKLYGLSFNTMIGETAFAGEFAYRQDEPLQIDDIELLYAAMPEQLGEAGLRPELRGISQLDTVAPGAEAQGFILRDSMQLQFTATHLFGPTLGADSWALLAEVGGIKISDMPEYDELRLNVAGTGRSGVMQGPAPDYTLIHQALSNGPETNPFPTDSAWGYKLVAKGDYSNIMSGWNFSPRVVFSHDVSGITPDPLYLFIEDRKSLGVTFNFNYQNAWSVDLGYNSFFGGGATNNFADRDYISFNIKYSI